MILATLEPKVITTPKVVTLFPTLAPKLIQGDWIHS